jgi:hypothetical protein
MQKPKQTMPIITEYKVNRSIILIKEQDIHEHLHEALQEVKLIKGR